MKRKIISGLLCLVLAITASSTVVFAASYSNYTLTAPRTAGATKELTAVNKEYTGVAVTSQGNQSVTVSLYKSGILSNTWYGNDQALSAGANRRAWWYGDISNNYNYYLFPSTNATTINLTGTFQNYQ
jgi:hypothetical protein